MDRSTTRVALSIALAGFGGCRALYIPALIAGPSAPLLLIGFALQAALGIAAGVGVWRGAPWAPRIIVLLGASVAATALVEGFVLEILAALRALLEAVSAIVIGLVVAAYVGDRPGAASPSR